MHPIQRIMIVFILILSLAVTIAATARAGQVTADVEKNAASPIEDKATLQEVGELQYKKSGFSLGVSTSGLIALDPVRGGGPGKFDLLVGYQFNEYFSLHLDMWTVIFLVYGVEANPRVYFYPGHKISPYVTASLGYAGVPFLDNIISSNLITYSGGLGMDVRLGKHAIFFIESKYRGLSATFAKAIAGEYGQGLEAGLGLRWVF